MGNPKGYANLKRGLRFYLNLCVVKWVFFLDLKNLKL